MNTPSSTPSIGFAQPSNLLYAIHELQRSASRPEYTRIRELARRAENLIPFAHGPALVIYRAKVLLNGC